MHKICDLWRASPADATEVRRAGDVIRRSARACLALALLICSPAASGAADTEAGFTRMFDGKTLGGWSGKTEFWSVRDGAITGETTEKNPTPNNTFLIFNEEFGDFELRLETKILSGNSGIQFRSSDRGNHVVHGYQADLDASEKFLGDLYDEGGTRNALAKGGEKIVFTADGSKTVVGQLHPLQDIAKAVRWNDWNDYVVIARGNHIVQMINGLTTVDVVDADASKARSRGFIALQLHTGPPMLVQFRNVRIRKL